MNSEIKIIQCGPSRITSCDSILVTTLTNLKLPSPSIISYPSVCSLTPSLSPPFPSSSTPFAVMSLLPLYRPSHTFSSLSLPLFLTHTRTLFAQTPTLSLSLSLSLFHTLSYSHLLLCISRYPSIGNYSFTSHLTIGIYC